MKAGRPSGTEYVTPLPPRTSVNPVRKLARSRTPGRILTLLEMLSLPPTSMNLLTVQTRSPDHRIRPSRWVCSMCRKKKSPRQGRTVAGLVEHETLRGTDSAGRPQPEYRPYAGRSSGYLGHQQIRRTPRWFGLRSRGKIFDEVKPAHERSRRSTPRDCPQSDRQDIASGDGNIQSHSPGRKHCVGRSVVRNRHGGAGHRNAVLLDVDAGSSGGAQFANGARQSTEP